MQMTLIGREHRTNERYRANAPYTRVVVREGTKPEVSLTEPKPLLEGHAYDVSTSGLRFELDNALAAGTPITIELYLPGCIKTIHGKGHVVRVFETDDDPGPRRMAAHFDTFDSESDRSSLTSHLADRWLPSEI
ncbi:MAG: PilZ domain-containing protein [Planctomycetota bacterium]|nr:PilZ domain-containing protein [Planctomycetota bacterium]